MPCEACNVQFTVFRRKRCCFDCKRFYCSNCLNAPSLRSSLGPLCERCSVFARRPLLKVDLLQLKPKDLIFYLQSKHISTAGCVEKDELVGLVLNHIQQADESHTASSESNGRSFDSAPSFDTLKQSCQNFFSNISEKVDAFSFEAKPNQTKTQTQNNRRSSTSTTAGVHISEQPRVSTREIPTYASFKNRSTDDADTQIHTATSVTANPVHINKMVETNALGTERIIAGRESGTQLPLETISLGATLCESDDKALLGSVSGCDCSDDEIINTFRARSADRVQSPQSTSSLENPVAGPSGSSNVLTSTSTNTKKSSPSLKIESYDESSESSFEELGAIGGISDDSKTGADNSVQASEPWQFVEKDVLEIVDGITNRNQVEVDKGQSIGPLTVAVIQSNLTVQVKRPAYLPTRPKKPTRRRSDSYINRTRPRSIDIESPPGQEAHKITAANFTNTPALHEEDEADNEKDVTDANLEMADVVAISTPFQCKRCGKHRINIKNHVEKLRRHLENSQMTEDHIKRELEEFLVYLEKRTKSFDCSDSETTAASSMSGTRDSNCQFPLPSGSNSPPQLYDDNEGIHVYAAPANFSVPVTDSRFINLDDYESLEELEGLCVKQLKEILMLNRVDYKGCCEKQELLDRVVRLWKNLKSTPTIDKLQTDELCKICMDAPIECVILECGHMATCTSCGKVLSECPICRQYIVRVVRFFKA